MTVLAPGQLLDQARRLLDEFSPGTVSVWSRASALLARQALEEALCQFWRCRAPGVEYTTMRAQLACLPTYLSSNDLAADAAYTWHALSRATHHHPYELDPTREELTSLLGKTDRLVEAVTASAEAA